MSKVNKIFLTEQKKALAEARALKKPQSSRELIPRFKM